METSPQYTPEEKERLRGIQQVLIEAGLAELMIRSASKDFEEQEGKSPTFYNLTFYIDEVGPGKEGIDPHERSIYMRYRTDLQSEETYTINFAANRVNDFANSGAPLTKEQYEVVYDDDNLFPPPSLY